MSAPIFAPNCTYSVQLRQTDKRSITECTFQWNPITFWSFANAHLLKSLLSIIKLQIAQGTNDIGPKIHSVQLRTQKNGIIFKHLSTEETITCQHLCSAQFSRQLLASARNKQMTLAHKYIHSVQFGAQNKNRIICSIWALISLGSICVVHTVFTVCSVQCTFAMRQSLGSIWAKQNSKELVEEQ